MIQPGSLLQYLLFCSLKQGTPISANLLFSLTFDFVTWKKVHRSKFYSGCQLYILFCSLKEGSPLSPFPGLPLVLSYLLFCFWSKVHQFHSNSGFSSPYVRFFEARYTNSRSVFGYLLLSVLFSEARFTSSRSASSSFLPSVLFSEARFTSSRSASSLSYLLFCSLKQGTPVLRVSPVSGTCSSL